MINTKTHIRKITHSVLGSLFENYYHPMLFPSVAINVKEFAYNIDFLLNKLNTPSVSPIIYVDPMPMFLNWHKSNYC